MLAACSGERRHAADILTRAAAVVEQQPDSALLLLESITYSEELRKSLQMEYALLSVQAKDKAYLDIANDTTIFAVAGFFERKKDEKKAALAFFYAGRVRQEQQRYKEATHCYLHAIDHAKQVEDKTLQGMASYNLGRLSYGQLLIDKAIACYKQAYLCFCHKPDDYRRQAMALTSIGDGYLVNKQQDSALYYYEVGLKAATLHGDSTLQSSICQSVGVAFREQGAAAKAYSYFLRAVHLGVNDLDKIVLYRNLANSYLSLGRRDSALLYMRLLLPPNMQDSTAMGQAITQELLSGIEELQGSYKKALEYYKQYASYQAKEYENILNNSMHEVEKKYEMEQVENKHNRKLIWHQRVIIGALGLMLFAALTCLWVYRRYLYTSKLLRKKELEMVALMEQAKEVEEKERQLREEQTLAHESERLQLKEQVISLEAKEKMLYDLRLDLLKKASLLKSGLSPKTRSDLNKEESQLDLAIYGSNEGSDWQLLYSSLNKLSDGFLGWLQRQYPQLGETEFKVCCLTYARFSSKETSKMLKKSSQTVLNLRSIIRTELAMPSGADIYEFLHFLSRNRSANS